jgi:hypothetical protein
VRELLDGSPLAASAGLQCVRAELAKRSSEHGAAIRPANELSRRCQVASCN